MLLVLFALPCTCFFVSWNHFDVDCRGICTDRNMFWLCRIIKMSCSRSASGGCSRVYCFSLVHEHIIWEGNSFSVVAQNATIISNAIIILCLACASYNICMARAFLGPSIRFWINMYCLYILCRFPKIYQTTKTWNGNRLEQFLLRRCCLVLVDSLFSNLTWSLKFI